MLVNNWKLIAGGVAALVIAIGIAKTYKDTYNRGVLAERAVWVKKAELQAKVNKEFELRLATSIRDYGLKILNESNKRVEKETIYKNKIETIIKDNPIYTECKVDDQVLEYRNSIRETLK
jgi:hypothetical protein